ncbi:MAG TPA: MFS transporter [Candidatus Corynebacterium avicola]|uniref:MFS transporter n=1 Tax=Candidatus Corynebacterium avicola TaxID=2838527 RepID=A0A9D1RLK2_9CORY|nr:MFS transporter [Candidatus Corynebacterium avicola]
MPESRQTDSRRWLILASLSLLQFLIAVDVTVVNVALPDIGRHFDADPGQLTWVVVGYTVAGGGLLMLGGRLGDLLGRRRMLITGVVIFGAASLVAGLAPSFGVLVAARLAQGAGEALAAPAAMSVIVLMFPEGPLRSRALGVWAAVASSGLVVGFVLSGVITEFLGWRWVFLVSVPFVALVLVASLILVPSGRTATQDATADVPGALLLTGAPLLFIAGVVEAGEAVRPWWVPTLLLIGAVVATVALVKVERRAADPLLPPKILAHRSRLGANGATMLLSAALSSSFLLFTFLLQDRMGLSPLTTGLTLVPLALSLILASVYIPQLIERWGAQVCALTGIACAALGMVAIAVAASLDAGTVAGPFSLVPAMLLIAAGMGFGIVALQYVAVSGVTDEDAATASGVQRAADQLGGATGVALFIGIGFSPVLTGGADTLAPYVLSAALAVLGLLAGAVVVRRAIV